MTSPPVSSPENPLPVRSVATKVAGWIDRLGSIWVEGQLTQVSVRQGTRTGADGQHCWAGFHIIDLAEDQAAALEILLKHL